MVYTGKTKNLGVIGYPIKHSLSPVIQNAAIAAANIDYAYIAMAVEPKNLEAAVKGLKAADFCGFNVTIPHKVAVMQYLDEIDETARMIGAVNTVKIKEGRLYGYNTDAVGFINPLLKENFTLKGKIAVILGAGGACRAVVCGLMQNGVKNIVLGVRNQAKGEKLAQEFSSLTDSADIRAYDWHSEEFCAWLERADLLVNATPLGMNPNVEAMPPVDWDKVKKSAFVYDIVYIPSETRFLREAKERGHKTLNGERMLAEQGAAALNFWTGAQASAEIMTETLRSYLAKNIK